MYKLTVTLIIITSITAFSKLNLLNDNEAYNSVKKYFAPILKEKNSKTVEKQTLDFIREIESAKETTFLTLKEDSSSKENYDLLKNYQRIVEIFVAFEALDEFIKMNPEKRNCTKAQEDYKMSLPANSSEYTSHQTLVLELYKKICNQN